MKLVRSEGYALLVLRTNRWFLGVIFMLPLLVAVIRYLGSGSSMTGNTVVAWDMLNGFTAPVFILAMFFGLMASRSDDSDRGNDATHLLVANRRWRWASKTIVVALSVVFSTIASQSMILLGIYTLGLWNEGLRGSALTELMSFSICAGIASVLGLAATSRGLETINGALLAIIVFWIGPTIFAEGAISRGFGTFRAADLNPVQIAERLTWQDPQVPLSFQGLEQSELGYSQAWMAMFVWLSLALIAVFSPPSKMRFRKMRARAGALRSQLAAKARKHPIAGVHTRGSSALADAYSIASDRANQWFALAACLLVVTPMAIAGTDATIKDPVNLAQSTFFAFGPTALIATYFFVAIKFSRELAAGHLGQRMTDLPARWRFALSQFALHATLFSLAFVIALVGTAVALQLGGRLPSLNMTTMGLLSEAAIKLAGLTAAVVAAGIGTALLVKSQTATLLACLAVTLILPGVLVAGCVAFNNLELLSQASMWLPTQTWVATHSSPNLIVTDAYQNRVLGPDERNWIAGGYGAVLLLLGGLRFRFGSIL